jgi:hypothetical protein
LKGQVIVEGSDDFTSKCQSIQDIQDK